MTRIQIVESLLSLAKDFGFNLNSQRKFLKDFKYKSDKILFIS